MVHVIDIRALQGAGRSGVEVYIEGFLHELLEEKRIQDREKVILWGNAHGDVKLPGFLKKYVGSVELVKTKVPNKLLNLCCSFMRWPKIDQLKGLKELLGDVALGEVTLWVLDPRPAPVSKGVKKQIVVHDLSSVKCPYFFSLRSKLWFRVVRLRKELKEAEKIYAVSEFTKSELLGLDSTLESKIEVKCPYVDALMPGHEYSDTELQEVRGRYGFPDKFLLSLSTLEPRKNIPTVIKKFLTGEFAEYPYLVVAGQKNTSIFKEEKYEQNDRVIFTGFVPEQDKWALYRLASGFVCLSQYEGYGIPVKEAMAFGLPLILSDIPPFREVVGAYKDVTWVQI